MPLDTNLYINHMTHASKPVTTKSWQKGVLLVCFMMGTQFALGQRSVDGDIKKAPATRSTSASVPSGYQQVGNTLLYYTLSASSIDIIGAFGSTYYGSTFSNRGYTVAMKVGNNAAVNVDCLNGTTNNGVTFSANVLEQGELARICYTLTNTNAEDVAVSLGIHADVMIGNNDGAPISRRIDSSGNTYGLTLKDGNGAQLCVLFGSGLSGVTSVNDFWFGSYYLNRDLNQMVGSYSSGDNYMVENGAYDSGLGWCWKERTIAAGSTAVFSWLIGVGEVNLEPSSSFEATPDDPDGWNDLSRPHRLTLDGLYESPAGLSGAIDYAVEDSEEWIALTDTLESGESFRESLIATFIPNRPRHIIRFRTRDLVGNTTMLPPIEYLDVNYCPVSNILDKTYCGDSLYQTELVCDLDTGQYAVRNYSNNLNAGVASFRVEGVFPHTIGRKTYNFTILPATLEGSVAIADNNFVYNGYPQIPEWSFTESVNDTLKADIDYELVLNNNTLPGEATLSIIGKGNYSGVLSSVYTINKAPLTEDLYRLELPEADITYDELPHGASIQVADGVGEATLYYESVDDGEYSPQRPSSIGSYNILLEIADGTLYYGKAMTQVGSFSIYQFDEAEWRLLQDIHAALIQRGWTEPWNLSQGIKSAAAFDGLTIKEGHVIGVDLSDMNLSGEFPVEILSLPQLQSLDLSNNALSGQADNVAMFAMRNPELLQNITCIDISDNQIAGNIGIFAKAFPNLESLKASNNSIEDVYPMISPKVAVLELAPQKIERVMDIHLKDMNVEALATKTPTILLYNHSQQAYNLPVNFHCSTKKGWGFNLSYRNDQVSIICSSDDNVYRGMSGDTLLVSVSDTYGSLDGTTLHMKLSFDDGDANFNGDVNILDLQATINFVFKEYQNYPFNHTAANLQRKDDVIDVLDVIGLVDLLMNNDASIENPSQAKARTNTYAATDAEGYLYWEGNRLILETTKDIAALDIALQGGSTLQWNEALGMTVVYSEKDTHQRIICYSMSGKYIPQGKHVLLTATTPCEVVTGLIADRAAQKVEMELKAPVYTGIEATTPTRMQCHYQDGWLQLCVDGAWENIQWEVYATDGRLLAKGTLPYAESCVANLWHTDKKSTIVVLVKDNNGMVLTQKINTTK